MMVRTIISGKPSILIYRGRIDEKKIIKENITINELQERLRTKDIFNLEDVEYAILETSGEITVIPKPSKRNLTPEDFNIETEYVGIPYDLVIDGKIMNENLKKIGKDYNWLKTEVNKFNIEPEEALVVVLSGNRKYILSKENVK